MKVVKFPNSAQLFKFCQKVLTEQTGRKVHDQELGSILAFNPSDCSHWKKGEKSIKSIFALEKLSKALKVEISLIYDLASGRMGWEEAFFEYQEAVHFNEAYKLMLSKMGAEAWEQRRQKILSFVSKLHTLAEFKTPPLYLPEVFRFFPFISVQNTDIMDKLSRVLRTKPNQYVIQYKKGELKSQTRMSMSLDLARIILSAERSRYEKELGPAPEEAWVPVERMFFCATLLCPPALLLAEMQSMDPRKNILSELSNLFWAPKSLLGFQIQDTLGFQHRGLQKSSESQVEARL